MTAPVVAQVFSDMEKRGGSSESTRKFHHQLSKAYTKRQNKWVVSLLRTFSKHQVCLAETDDEVFRNIITGQIFSDEIYYDLIGAYDKGQELRKVFADERLKPDSKVGIFVIYLVVTSQMTFIVCPIGMIPTLLTAGMP